MSGRGCIHSPCSKGCPLTAVAFILRASLADVSQCEPLLVSWSLSAWSLSPWPLSRRLARSASLNVELQQNGRMEEEKRRKHKLPLPLRDRSYVIAVVSCWLDTKMKKLNALVRKLLERALTFEQMVACCQHNWALRGNFPSRNERKNNVLHWLKFSCNFQQQSKLTMTFRRQKKCTVFRFFYLLHNTWKGVNESHRAPASDDGIISLHCDHMCRLGRAKEKSISHCHQHPSPPPLSWE